MEHFFPELIYIDDSAAAYSKTYEIVAKLPDVPVRRIHEKSEALADLAHIARRVDRGKKILYLTTQKGRFFKKCPGTKGLICCNYYVINFATNCHLDCSYCILQEYLENNPFITFFVNIDDLLAELDQAFSEDPQRVYRVGTGEFTDSLAMDEITEFSKIVVPFFASRPNATLELKTKTDTIEQFVHLDHRGHTSVAWSVNPPRIIASEEPKTATLDERLRAAALCQQAGYPIGFHFDPIILQDLRTPPRPSPESGEGEYPWEGDLPPLIQGRGGEGCVSPVLSPEWEREYHQVVERLFDVVKPQNISWISLGGFRYTPELKPMIRQRFPHSRILCGEFVTCADGKMRYLKHLRVPMYTSMLAKIKRYGKHIPVYLCMDSKQVWQRVYGWTPNCDQDLTHLFDRRLSL